jgi:hypothetical protein
MPRTTSKLKGTPKKKLNSNNYLISNATVRTVSVEVKGIDGTVIRVGSARKAQHIAFSAYPQEKQSTLARVLLNKLRQLLTFSFMSTRGKDELQHAYDALSTPPINQGMALEQMTIALKNTLSAFHRVLDDVASLEREIVTLKAEKATVGMRLNGNDRKKAAVEVIVRVMESDGFRNYIPNKGRNLTEKSLTNNPYLYIKDNIEDSLKSVGLEDFAYDSSIYRSTMPKFYKTLRSYQWSLNNPKIANEADVIPMDVQKHSSANKVQNGKKVVERVLEDDLIMAH